MYEEAKIKEPFAIEHLISIVRVDMLLPTAQQKQVMCVFSYSLFMPLIQRYMDLVFVSN